MGCDIHGFVEAVPNSEDRNYVRYLNPLIGMVGRSYDTFGCLFGVRNYPHFDPLFPERGFPDEMSYRGRSAVKDAPEEGGIGCHSATYCTLEELQNVNWDEEAEDTDLRMSVVNEDGETQIKAGYMSRIQDNLSDDEQERLRNGERVRVSDTDGEARYAVHKTMQRRDALSGAWEWLIFDLMPMYDGHFTDCTIRLTVWFDN